jgi:hypothetical protein
VGAWLLFDIGETIDIGDLGSRCGSLLHTRRVARAGRQGQRQQQDAESEGSSRLGGGSRHFVVVLSPG